MKLFSISNNHRAMNFPFFATRPMETNRFRELLIQLRPSVRTADGRLTYNFQ